MIARFETLFPERLASAERERHVGNRLDDAVGRREADGQPTDVEQLAFMRRAHA